LVFRPPLASLSTDLFKSNGDLCFFFPSLFLHQALTGYLSFPPVPSIYPKCSPLPLPNPTLLGVPLGNQLPRSSGKLGNIKASPGFLHRSVCGIPRPSPLPFLKGSPRVPTSSPALLTLHTPTPQTNPLFYFYADSPPRRPRSLHIHCQPPLGTQPSSPHYQVVPVPAP